MPTITRYPSSVVSLGTWVNGTYAYADDTSYATNPNSSKNSDQALDLGGFDFSAIPDGSIINSVTIRCREYVSATSTMTTKVQPWDGSAIGTQQTHTPPTGSANEASWDTTWTVTLANLKSANFFVRYVTRRGGNTASTTYLDFIAIIVDYSRAMTFAGETIPAGALAAQKDLHQSYAGASQPAGALTDYQRTPGGHDPITLTGQFGTGGLSGSLATSRMTLLSLAGAFAGGGSFVGSGYNSLASGTTLGVTMSATVQPGDLIVVLARMGLTSTVSDTLGTSYTQKLADAAAGLWIWYGVATSGGANTVTVNEPSASRIGLCVSHYRGVAGGDPFDLVTAAALTSGVAGISSPAFTTAQASEVVVCICGGNVTPTPEADYALLGGDGNGRTWFAHRLTTGVLTNETVDWTSAVGNLQIAAIAFKFGSGLGATLATQKTSGMQTATYTAALTLAGTLAKRVGKTLVGASQPVGTLAKRVLTTLVGALTSGGTLASTKTKLQTATGASQPAGTLVKRPGKTVTGASQPTGTVAKQVRATKTGATTPSGTLAALKSFYRTVTGASTPTGTVATTKTKLQTVTGASQPTGTVSKQVRQTKTGASQPTGTVTKQPRTTFTGASQATGALTTVKTKLQSLAGALAPTATFVKRTLKALTGTLASAGTVAKRTTKLALAGATTPTGAVTTIKTKLQTVTGAIASSATFVKRTVKAFAGATQPTGTARSVAPLHVAGSTAPTGTLAKRTGKTVTGATTPSGTLATIKTKLLTVVGSLAPAATFVKRTGKVLTGTLASAGALTKRLARTWAGASAPSGTLAQTKTQLKTVTGATTPTGALTKRSTWKTLTGSLDSAGTVAKRLSRTITASTAPTGTLAKTKTATVTLAGSTAPTGTLKRLTVRLVAGATTFAGAFTTVARKAMAFVGLIEPTGGLSTTIPNLEIHAPNARTAWMKPERRTYRVAVENRTAYIDCENTVAYVLPEHRTAVIPAEKRTALRMSQQPIILEDKAPVEVKDYAVDFADELERVGDTALTSATWPAQSTPAGLTLNNQAVSGTKAGVFVGGGTVGVDYSLTVVVETNGTPKRTYSRTIIIPCR